MIFHGLEEMGDIEDADKSYSLVDSISFSKSSGVSYFGIK